MYTYVVVFKGADLYEFTTFLDASIRYDEVREQQKQTLPMRIERRHPDEEPWVMFGQDEYGSRLGWWAG